MTVNNNDIKNKQQKVNKDKQPLTGQNPQIIILKKEKKERIKKKKKKERKNKTYEEQ